MWKERVPAVYFLNVRCAATRRIRAHLPAILNPRFEWGSGNIRQLASAQSRDLPMALTKSLASAQSRDFTFLPLTPEPQPKTLTLTHPLKVEDVPNSTITLTHPQTLTLTSNYTYNIYLVRAPICRAMITWPRKSSFWRMISVYRSSGRKASASSRAWVGYHRDNSFSPIIPQDFRIAFLPYIMCGDSESASKNTSDAILKLPK